MNRDSDKLGRNIAHFAAPENLPGNPQTFSGNAKAVGPLDNWHGFSGWACDRNDAGTSSYEQGLFRGYKDGSAFKNWGVPGQACSHSTRFSALLPLARAIAKTFNLGDRLRSPICVPALPATAVIFKHNRGILLCC